MMDIPHKIEDFILRKDAPLVLALGAGVLSLDFADSHKMGLVGGAGGAAGMGALSGCLFLCATLTQLHDKK
jgi:hypothetical protein